MSSQADTSIALVVAEQTVVNYCSNAVSTLVVYEYFITLGREIQLFWRGKWTGAAILFFFNRYLSLTVYIYMYWLVDHRYHISAQSCPGEIKAYLIIEIMQYLPWAVFSTLRALALTHNYPMAVFVFCLSIVPIPINFTPFAKGLTGVIHPIVGCVISDNISQDLYNSLTTIISRTCLIAADGLLLGITWANLYRRGTLRLIMRIDGLVAVFLRDGTIYFIVLAFLNALQMMQAILPENLTQSGYMNDVVELWGPITTILVSRFLLNLQSTDRRARNPQGTTLHDGGTGSLIFERVIGSLGSSIYVNPEEDDFEDMLEEDEDVGRLTVEAGEDLTDVGGQHHPNAEADLEGGLGMEMTTLSLLDSRLGTTN